MFNTLLKNLSILKKFLFINLIIFIIIGSFTIIYLSSVKPNLTKTKTSNHINSFFPKGRNCGKHFERHYLKTIFMPAVGAKKLNYSRVFLTISYSKIMTNLDIF